MIGFSDVQRILDDAVGAASAGNHGTFWRGKSRDQFVAFKVHGLPLIKLGDAAASNLIKALRGEPPFGKDLVPRPAGALIERMPKGLPPVAPETVDAIAAWISAGCPEPAQHGNGAERAALAVGGISDDDHVRFWREMDFFFHPIHSSPETSGHVGRIHVAAYIQWAATFLQAGDPNAWESYANDPDTIASFEYIRLHQRRLISEFLGSQPSAIMESLWKFGGDLLPRDPQSGALPEHRMNGLSDWNLWVPYLSMSLAAADRTDIDLVLARGWQAGLVADGLLRTDNQRDVRMPIAEFQAGQPNLEATVFATYAAMEEMALTGLMLERARIIDQLPEEPQN